MKKIVKLTESQIIKLIKNVISEQPREMDPLIAQPTSGDYLNRTAGNKGQIIPKNVLKGQKLDGSLFGNSVDKIDKNSEPYRNALSAFKDLINQVKATGFKNYIPVQVEGGASAVGQKQGFDNQGLAKRRAQNFINAIQTDIPNSPLIFNLTTKIGKATEKNSPEAQAEQYVKINVNDINTSQNKLGQVGRDNTAVRYGEPVKPKNNVVTDERDVMVLKVYFNKGTKKTVLGKLYGATREERTVTQDVTAQAKNCGII